jgi:aminopeptidase-like protein
VVTWCDSQSLLVPVVRSFGQGLQEAQTRAEPLKRHVTAARLPVPVARVTSKHPLYDWEEVAGWLVERDALAKEELVRARIVKEANLHLEAADVPDDNFMRRLEAAEAL